MNFILKIYMVFLDMIMKLFFHTKEINKINIQWL